MQVGNAMKDGRLPMRRYKARKPVLKASPKYLARLRGVGAHMSFWLPRRTAEVLRQESIKRGTNMSELVRLALGRFLGV